ncbi:MAG: FKBP-type peptidyl-prolyl cis-trans isomerase [Bacteroidales bacterium]|jgi:FKBP-type peptidyl-prolyl cis-trans isomerase|nr:FKBP-type peptidyl-prolyl cis-trans isomerase [Bacteroidales bacterium]
MKNLFITAGAVLAAAIMFSSCNEAKKEVKLSSKMDSASYALGMNQGSMLASQLKTLPGDSVNKKLFLDAFSKALMEDSIHLKFNQDTCVKVLQSYFSELDRLQQIKMQEEALQNKIASDSALNANKEKEGVVVTASGLQYRVITEGTGKKPKETDVVKVNYKGTLVDGTVFDSSDLHGQPAVFGLQGVIPGWTEGLQLMSVGSKYEFLIPSELAYGSRGNQGIKPNSALFFEIELLEIMPEKKK